MNIFVSDKLSTVMEIWLKLELAMPDTDQVLHAQTAELYGAKHKNFDYAGQPERGRLEGTRDFTDKPVYRSGWVQGLEFSPDPYFPSLPQLLDIPRSY